MKKILKSTYKNGKRHLTIKFVFEVRNTFLVGCSSICFFSPLFNVKLFFLI